MGYTPTNVFGRPPLVSTMQGVALGPVTKLTQAVEQIHERNLAEPLPRTGNGPLDSIMNMLSAEPRETAAVLHGILAGPIAPTVGQRAAMEIPALVIGHKVDHVHPFHDAQQLARRLPQGQLIQASSVLELRVHPERLTEEINGLLDTAWRTPAKRARKAG